MRQMKLQRFLPLQETSGLTVKLEFDGGYFMNMKKVFQVICCAAGAGMIGFFANQLNNVVGCVFFTLGVALLVGSIILVSKKDKEDK